MIIFDDRIREAKLKKSIRAFVAKVYNGCGLSLSVIDWEIVTVNFVLQKRTVVVCCQLIATYK
jgi:hypothetical protein